MDLLKSLYILGILNEVRDEDGKLVDVPQYIDFHEMKRKREAEEEERKRKEKEEEEAAGWRGGRQLMM